ncbi:hypothetical protein AKJ16_DCAP24681 [Drosera capensis]
MEGRKQAKGSCSSTSSKFPSELFGAKETAKNDVFSSIFAANKVEGSRQKQLKQDNADKNHSCTHRESAYKDNNLTFHEEKAHPCHLSSSLYYGGQEMYLQPPAKQTPGSYYKKDNDEEDDDSSGNNSYGVPRGNWWEGSLYY